MRDTTRTRLSRSKQTGGWTVEYAIPCDADPVSLDNAAIAIMRTKTWHQWLANDHYSLQEVLFSRVKTWQTETKFGNRQFRIKHRSGATYMGL